MKLKNISRIAAVICAAAAVFAVSGLRLSDAGELDSAAFRPYPQVAAETVGAGDGALTDAAAGRDTDRQNDSSKSDNSSPENAAADSDGLSRLPGDNSAPDGGESCDSSTDKGRQRQVAPDSPSQPEELPGDEPEDGDDTDEQLFVTSIKDGEHVTDSLYSFTITHLNESYKLKTLTVRVNGRRVPWSGSVTLADGTPASASIPYGLTAPGASRTKETATPTAPPATAPPMTAGLTRVKLPSRRPTSRSL